MTDKEIFIKQFTQQYFCKGSNYYVLINEEIRLNITITDLDNYLGGSFEQMTDPYALTIDKVIYDFKKKQCIDVLIKKIFFESAGFLNFKSEILTHGYSRGIPKSEIEIKLHIRYDEIFTNEAHPAQYTEEQLYELLLNSIVPNS